MLLVDLMCKECDREEIDVFVDMKQPMPCCPECGKEMVRMVARRMSFELKYDNRRDSCDWNGNTSSYWNEIKKQKSEGKKVEEPKNEKSYKWS